MSKLKKVKIVGVGLLGSSLGLALSRSGISCFLTDQSKANLRLAVEYGAGQEYKDQEVQLVVVCVPPDGTAEMLAKELVLHPDAVVTDVASVKQSIFEELALLNQNTARYVGSHPMAGREKGGPAKGRADLFFARPWVITPRSENPSQDIELVRELALAIGALPIELNATDHDEAVALVSHLPQLVASLLAAQLASGDQEQLQLAGQGLRDTTRIASSDPELWIQILSRNSHSVAKLLRSLSNDLQKLSSALENIEAAGSLAVVNEVLEAGNQGVAKIPGKHGGKYSNYDLITVIIDDAPGALAALFTFIGDIGVNIEDFKLEHSPGAQIGLVELQVMPQVASHLSQELLANGWRLV